MFSLGRTVVILLATALLLTSCTKKGDPAEAAKNFFQQLAAGQPAQAYAEAAFGFQAQQTEKAFIQNVKEMGLTKQDALEWQAPEVLANEALVRVTLTGSDGRTQAFAVTLVYESGAWRVHSLRSPRGTGSRTENRFTLVGKGAAFSDAQSQRMPEEKEIKQMILRTLSKFDEAVQQKSFADFYKDVAVAWQKQLTVGQLERAFQPFLNAGVRFGGLNEAEMQLDGPPTINTEGVLVINGHFQTAPYQVFFNMKFLYELPRWKLFGLDVNLQR
ncbi:MAG: hypothetical protein WCF18_02615 [Chthoniobacteraceae bacterium]